MKNYIKEYQNYLKILGLAQLTIKIYTSIVSKFLMQHPQPEKATQKKKNNKKQKTKTTKKKKTKNKK